MIKSLTPLFEKTSLKRVSLQNLFKITLTSQFLMFVVIETKTYQEELDKWTKADKEAAKKLPQKLSENPFVGKQLTYKFLREKHIGGRRVYYLIYEDFNLVLLVATSEKKDQQATIDHIKGNLDDLKALAEKISKQLS